MVNQGCASGIARGCRIQQGLRVLGVVPKLFPDPPGFHRICLSPSLSLSSLNLLILIHIFVEIWGLLVYSWYMCIYTGTYRSASCGV